MSHQVQFKCTGGRERSRAVCTLVRLHTLVHVADVLISAARASEPFSALITLVLAFIGVGMQMGSQRAGGCEAVTAFHAEEWTLVGMNTPVRGEVVAASELATAVFTLVIWSLVQLHVNSESSES